MGQQVGQAERGGDAGRQVLELWQEPDHRVGDDNADLGEAPKISVCTHTTALRSWRSLLYL